MSEAHSKDATAPAAKAAEPGVASKGTPSIVVSSKAAAKVKEQVAARAQSTPVSGIRVGVKGGGCSGLSYVIEFCDAPRAKDRLFEVDGARVYVDPKSLIYLNGTTLDFVETFQQKGFKFVNPQQRSECGCGESFSI
jgi:iron-sulfur cluster assembly protein